MFLCFCPSPVQFGQAKQTVSPIAFVPAGIFRDFLAGKYLLPIGRYKVGVDRGNWSVGESENLFRYDLY